MLFILLSCITPKHKPNPVYSGNGKAVRFKAEQLRDYDPPCIGTPLAGWGYRIESCLQIGTPKTLTDDGTTPYLVVTVWSDGLELADPGKFRIHVKQDGVLFLNQAPHSSSDMPKLALTEGGFFNIEVIELQRTPVAGETWAIEYTASFDVRSTATATFQFE